MSLTFIATGLGLAVGSFMNVVIYRLPIMSKRKALMRRQSETNNCNADPNYDLNKTFNLNVPRSACPTCNHKITSIENIPVLSWIVLRGKCRSCKSPISVRYPFIELLNAVLWGAIASFNLNGINLLVINCLLVSTFVCMIAIKLDKQYIPKSLITVALCLLGVSLFSFLKNDNAILFT